MESQVEEIKKKLGIVEVIGKYLPIKKRGRHYVACCPFHGEKTPSFTVSPELQIFKCFGCGKSGDIFTFVEEFDHVDFKDALEDLAKLAGITLIKSRELTAAETHHRRLIALNHELAKFYNFILTSHPLGKTALDYVLGRGITSDTIKLFRLGFSPSSSALTLNYLAKKGFTTSELVASGTFGKSQYRSSQMYDRFFDRLVFPLSDFRDRILGFSGRTIPGQSRVEGAKYINSPETDIYHKSQMLFGLNLAKESIKKKNAVLIVEGEFDMISPYQHGVLNVVAIKGTAFTADQLQLLKRYTDTLIIGLDSDFAGNNAARKSIELADSMGFDLKVLDLSPRFKDPDEAIKADPQFFDNQLSHPEPIWDFIINSAIQSHDATTIKGKKEILSLTLPSLIKISNSVVKSDYYHKLASLIGSDVNSIIDEAKKLSLPESKKDDIFSIPTISPQSSKVDNLEEFLLTLIFSAQNPVVLASKVIDQYYFSLPRFQKIILNLTSVKDAFSPQDFALSLSPELVSVFQNIYLASTYLNLDSNHRLKEIKKTLDLLHTHFYKEELNSLSAQIARAENSSDETAVAKLEQKYNQLLRSLSQLQTGKS